VDTEAKDDEEYDDEAKGDDDEAEGDDDEAEGDDEDDDDDDETSSDVSMSSTEVIELRDDAKAILEGFPPQLTTQANPVNSDVDAEGDDDSAVNENENPNDGEEVKLAEDGDGHEDEDEQVATVSVYLVLSVWNKMISIIYFWSDRNAPKSLVSDQLFHITNLTARFSRSHLESSRVCLAFCGRICPI